MSAEHELDLATTEGIILYLVSTPFASDNVTSLSGGYGNFTYRVHLQTPYEGLISDVVVKYAPPYVAATQWRMPFAVERQVSCLALSSTDVRSSIFFLRNTKLRP